MSFKAAFYTLGCKVNQYETNAMISIFQNDGFEIVDFDEIADVYVINTCTVTGMSDKKSRQIIRRAKFLNPNSIVCAVGCYAQVSKEDLEKIKDIDIILGTIEKKDLLPKVKQLLNDKEHRITEVQNIMHPQEYSEFGSIAFSSHIRAEIKIQDGCDRFCTYCIIPYARGPVRSRLKDDIIKEITALASRDSIKEVVLTGIHISSYGKDLSKNRKDDPHYAYEYGLIDLLEDISKINGIERIRLGSLEPRIITSEFVDRLKKLPKVCNHFHLSLQSGCDSTLLRMNRKYSTSEYQEIVELLRNNIKDAAITTDIIVGFPGETDEEYNITYDFLNCIKLSKMHVFKYSRRKGTTAASFKDQVDESTKTIRSEKLIKMSNNNARDFASQYIGKQIDVLFENSKEGHTTNYIKIELENEMPEYENKIVKVIPKKYQNEVLIV